jgi:hypothetical protein
MMGARIELAPDPGLLWTQLATIGAFWLLWLVVSRWRHFRKAHRRSRDFNYRPKDL